MLCNSLTQSGKQCSSTAYYTVRTDKEQYVCKLHGRNFPCKKFIALRRVKPGITVSKIYKTLDLSRVVPEYLKMSKYEAAKKYDKLVKVLPEFKELQKSGRQPKIRITNDLKSDFETQKMSTNFLIYLILNGKSNIYTT